MCLTVGVQGLTAHPEEGAPRPEAAGRPPATELVGAYFDRTPLPYAEAIAPPLGRRNLELRYRAVGAAPSDSLRFAFRMDGLEEDWADVGSRTIAYYRDLEPGRYTFQVRTGSVGGAWGPTSEVPVVIDRYVYEEPWFFLLGLLSVLAVSAAGYRWQARQARRREATLERLVDERTQDLQAEKGHVEDALAYAEQERATAQGALGTVEEQSLQLLRMDHMKSRLFANISHEFRTPLTLILDPLDRALSGAFGPLGDDALRAFQQARENAHRLLHLIDQLLDLAKLEAGSMELRAHETDLVPLLRRAVEMFTSEAARRGIDLRFRTDADALPAYVDPDKLEKVVHNLITNALKATGAGGKVVLSVRRVHDEGDGEGQAEITVRDTGEGISEDEFPFIFDRFYQAETGRLRGGTGIGLSLAREMVELHRGRITAESEPGFGSTFTARLPLGRVHLADHEVGPRPDGQPAPVLPATPEPPASAPGPSTPEDPDDRHRPLVLVVEDNPEIRELVVGHLRPHYRVAEAEEGAEALRIARERRPVLVVSDVLMPGVDGLALCRRLKADKNLNDTPVLLLTARASDADRLEALQTGADAFLTKPFAAAELVAQADNLIRSRSALRDRYSEEVVLPTTGQAVTSTDAAFLERVYAAVNARLDDEGFTVGALATEVGVSESSLKRRVRPLLGMPPVEFIRTRRLERAAALLLGQAGTVSEVAAQAGFGSPSYFARCFREHYGVAPSEYLQQEQTTPRAG